jgi:cyclic pyranopterin phosphate synthase
MFSHVDDRGVTMVDVGGKQQSTRRAIAEGRILLSERTLSRIREQTVEKGSVLTTAQIAGIMAAKRTSELIPLCHQLPLNSVNVEFSVDDDGISARCLVSTTSRTGVEMEALVGVTQALLAIWDMVKALEKDEGGQYPTTRINDVHVVSKEK